MSKRRKEHSKKIRLEKDKLDINSKNTADIEVAENSKLKTSDWHREKIIESENRDFKCRKYKNKPRKKCKSNKLKIRKSSRDKKLKAKYKNKTKNEYASFDKDMDNEVHCDNDFRDRNISYENVHKKAKKNIKNSKSKKLTKRKNYSDTVYTRSEDTGKSNENIKPKINDKNLESDTKVSFDNISKIKESTDSDKYRFSTNKIKPINLSNDALFSIGKVGELTRRYLSNGSDENVGVGSAEKTAGVISKNSYALKRHLEKKSIKKRHLLKKKEQKRHKKEARLEFKDNIRMLRNTEGYKKADAYKKFCKRRQMKANIYKKYKLRLRDRVKQGLKDVLSISKQMIQRKVKGFLLAIIGIIFLGIIIMNFSGLFMTSFTNSTNAMVSTSYLSSVEVLTEINDYFSSLEQGLQDELDSVRDAHTGYDEYIIEKDSDIGHNIHELLSYITSRYGKVKDISEVKSDLQNLFNSMYSLEYKEDIEIRYRTVSSNYVDENGIIQSESHEESYEYKKLIITLKKKEMDSVIREIFADYQKNITHYETLLMTRGNMGNIFGNGNGDLSEIINNPDYKNPGLAFDEEVVKQLFSEAQRHIGKRYKFGAEGPANFDCSSFVCYSFTHSGVKNMPRTTAWGIYKTYCTPISPTEAKAGDIIFFKGTYNSGTPISHVGIYAGNGMMLHAGDPVKYSSINTPYYKEHFYGFGRVIGN